MPEPTARERLLNYALAATPNEATWGKAEQLADAHEAEHRGQVLAEAAAVLRAHCPRHGTAETSFVACHCPAATELERAARAARTAPDAP